jgi:hypothetical protein
MVKLSRFDRDYNNAMDKQQVKFTNTGWLEKPKPPKTETNFTTVNSNELVVCPFCLYQAKLSAFFISNKQGISQKKAHCPECNNGMEMSSLYNDWGSKEYAQWVYKYRVFGFWKKCPFEIWKKRLKQMGWSLDFWIMYKQLKGEDDVNATLNTSSGAMTDYEREKLKEYEESYP